MIARNDTDIWLVGTAMEQAARYMAPCGVTVVVCDVLKPDTFVITDRESAKELVRSARMDPFCMELCEELSLGNDWAEHYSYWDFNKVHGV